MEIGIYTFADVAPGGSHRAAPAPAGRGNGTRRPGRASTSSALGEHHRPDYAVSAPVVALAAGAARTKQHPPHQCRHRAELGRPGPRLPAVRDARSASRTGGPRSWPGRGSFIESFPLFGYDLDDYDALFAEKLDLLTEAASISETVTWQGRNRARRSTKRDALSAPRCSTRCRCGSRSAARRSRWCAPATLGLPHGARHHRRRPEAFRALFRSLPRGMVARQPHSRRT